MAGWVGVMIVLVAIYLGMTGKEKPSETRSSA
jgi:hypothetical protein